MSLRAPDPAKGRMRIVFELTAALCLSILIIAGLLLDHIHADHALAQAKTAATEAKEATAQALKVAQCVNNVLAERNQPAQADAQAHIAYANANATNADAQNKAAIAEVKVLVDPTGSALQATDFEAFLILQQAANEASTAYKAASVTYKQTLAADQADRNAHPLGKC